MRLKRRAFATMLLATVAMLSAGTTAMAHAELEASTPADGSQLEAVPAALSFSFREPLIPAGNAITLTGLETGSRFDLAEVETSGNTAAVTWPDAAGVGEYRAAYRVVSADGHPIAGSITFAIVGPDPGPGAPDAGPAPTGRVESPVAHTTGTLAAPTQTSAREENWVLGGIAVVLLAAGLVTWLIRRNRRT